MTAQPTQAPVLSTPETNFSEDPTPLSTSANESKLNDEELWKVYEISRAAKEIREGGYKRVALQFPDGMLRDAPRVYKKLEEEIKRLSAVEIRNQPSGPDIDSNTSQPSAGGDFTKETRVEDEKAQDLKDEKTSGRQEERVRLYVLADTSYGSCCVDEIAAEHVDAGVVVHYGRSCLSPTSRLPVIYVFTSRDLDIADVVSTFEDTFSGKEEKVVLMADIIYHSHIPAIHAALLEKGYTNVVAPEIIHNPESSIPNRKLPEVIGKEELKGFKLFHVSDPPQALLLALSSRVSDFYIYPTTTTTTTGKGQGGKREALCANSARALRRRYGVIISLSSTPIFGILINTLSVKSYLSTATALQSLIASAGKKSYTFVVGKVNSAKIANFSEIGGWVVVGCWESSLVEGADFYRPVITPFELGLCLAGDDKRIWDGSWWGGFGDMGERVAASQSQSQNPTSEEELEGRQNGGGKQEDKEAGGGEDSEEESEPPEFDLRTGRYVSNSRPMRGTTISKPPESGSGENGASKQLTRRVKGDLAVINGTVSPGAEYLRSMRTWTGLGSDFENGEQEAGATIEEGRTGIARGYRVGEEETERR